MFITNKLQIGQPSLLLLSGQLTEIKLTFYDLLFVGSAVKHVLDVELASLNSSDVQNSVTH